MSASAACEIRIFQQKAPEPPANIIPPRGWGTVEYVKELRNELLTVSQPIQVLLLGNMGNAKSSFVNGTARRSFLCRVPLLCGL